MANYFTGAQIKRLAKTQGCRDVVIRIKGNRVTMEVSDRDNRRFASLAIDRAFSSADEFAFVDLYALSSGTGFRFFVDNLKTIDQVCFHARRNSSDEFEKETGRRWLQCYATIQRSHKSGKVQAWETVLIDDFVRV